MALLKNSFREPHKTTLQSARISKPVTMRLFPFHMFSSTLSSQQSHWDIRWGNIMCYHGGDLPNSRHKESVRKTPWLGGGGGFQHNRWGRDKRLPPSGYKLPKRGSALGIVLHHHSPFKTKNGVANHLGWRRQVPFCLWCWTPVLEGPPSGQIFLSF